MSDDSFNTCGWCGAELSSSATGRIAFESDRTGSWQIFVMDADELTIYDLSGRRIFTQLLDAVPGRHSLMLEMEDYPQGVYLARIAGEGASDTRRFVISR